MLKFFFRLRRAKNFITKNLRCFYIKKWRCFFCAKISWHALPLTFEMGRTVDPRARFRGRLRSNLRGPLRITLGRKTRENPEQAPREVQNHAKNAFKKKCESSPPNLNKKPFFLLRRNGAHIGRANYKPSSHPRRFQSGIGRKANYQ